MFLRPHHLQQHDLFVESREIGYFKAIDHFGWGLIRMELQEDSLDNFVLAVRSLRAVMPDGTLIEAPGNAQLPSRTFDPKAYEVGRPLPVAIGVRQMEERRSQAAGEGTPGETRFVSVAEEVYDLETGRDPMPIEKLDYSVRFFLGEEPSHGYETMPVAQLNLTGDPARPVKLTGGFAPPCLALSASPVLHGEARGVVECLAKVLRDMGEVRGSDKVKELILFQALAGSFPVLKDMVQEGMVHPRLAYRELARLAGTLLFRDEEGRPFDDIPGYDHRELGPVFGRLRVLIEKLSEPIFERRYRRIPMERDKDLFRTQLPAEGKRPGVRFFLEALADDSYPQLQALVRKAKVSSQARIEQLTRSGVALPGIETEAQPGQPPEMPPGQTGSYYRLKLEAGPEWATHVIPAGDLGVSILGAPNDLKLNLIVIVPGK